MNQNIYQQKIKIRSTDVDMSRHLKLSSLFVYLQEAAFEDTLQRGASREMTMQRGFLWIVTQQTARFCRLPRYDETLTLSTWPGKAMHMFFPRYWELHGENGEPVISASSLWLLMSSETRKAVFPQEHGIRFPEVVTGHEIALPARVKPSFPPEAKASPFRVPYSYTDVNGHMNNARYFDLACDLLPDPLILPSIRTLNIEYVGEAAYGQMVTVRHALVGQAANFIGESELLQKNGKPRPVFRLQMTFSDT